MAKPSGYPTAITRFADKVRDGYPYGIPLDVWRKAGRKIETPPAQGLAHGRCVLFLIASAEPELSLPERQLLSSIVTKGLLLPESNFRARICVLSEVGDLAEWRTQVVQEEQGIDLVISMGLNLGVENGVIEPAPVATLHTVSLSEVLVSKDAKRLFWEHLQKCLARSEGSS